MLFYDLVIICGENSLKLICVVLCNFVEIFRNERVVFKCGKEFDCEKYVCFLMSIFIVRVIKVFIVNKY